MRADPSEPGSKRRCWTGFALHACLERVLPAHLAAQATLGVFTFLGTWNSYWWPLISATRSDMYTLTVGLAGRAQMIYAQTSGLGFLMAQAVFASIPIFFVYVLFQSRSCTRWRAAVGEMRRISFLGRALAGQLQARAAAAAAIGPRSTCSASSANAAPNMAAPPTFRRSRANAGSSPR
jgi:hypothetical protein